MPQYYMTYEELLAGAWNNDGRFDSLANLAIRCEAVKTIAQLALVGWTFCGCDEQGIELERDNEIAMVDRKTGAVELN